MRLIFSKHWNFITKVISNENIWSMSLCLFSHVGGSVKNAKMTKKRESKMSTTEKVAEENLLT